MPKRERRTPNIDPYYWSLWAVQQLAQYRNLGFPTQEPYYRPGRLSKVEVAGDGPRYRASVDDWRIAERIAGLVEQHRQIAPREVLCLEIWEGARPGDDGSLSERLKAYRVNSRTCRQMAYRARRAVDIAMGPINA
jgi:hypothetical protein